MNTDATMSYENNLFLVIYTQYCAQNINILYTQFERVLHDSERIESTCVIMYTKKIIPAT